MCAGALAADQGAGARDYNAERAALVATVIPPSDGAARGWESIQSAIRAVGMSQQRIADAIRLRFGLAGDVPIELDPLVLIDAPEEEAGAAGGAAEADEDGEVKAGEGEAIDMEAVELRGVRTLMQTYEGNHIYDRMTALRLQPQVFITLDDQPLMVRDFSYASGVRTLARLEAVRMWRFLEEGEEKKAADCFDGLLALGVTLSREPTIMGRLQSIAVIGTATQTLDRWMLENRLDPGFARDLLARLERHAARLTPMSYTLEGERLTGLDTIARVFKRQIPAPMVMAEGEAGSLKSQEECEARLNELYDAMVAWADAPVHERKSIEPSPAQLASEMPAGLVLVKVIAPGLEEGVWLAELGRVDLEGTALMLALEAGRTEEGKYVESLDALAPEVMKALPRDGYAPDGRFGYRRTEGVQRAGTGYVLYSVGYDGEDNGGALAKGAPAAVALRPGEAGAGSDFVLNRRGEE